MEIYFAPMEGMTGCLFRRIHKEHFGGCDKYFTPFISTNENITLNNKEKSDVDPAENEGMNLVPQIISNSASQSAEYILKLNRDHGYREININLGCPSGTVVSKNKGSGMLRDPENFESFLSDLEKAIEEVRKSGEYVPDLSIKTRIGYYSSDECEKITKILVSHPVKQVIVHPRSRNQMYEGKVNLEEFSRMYEALRERGMGVVYNGDIRTPEDYLRIVDAYPGLDGVMIGRGLLADPSLARRIKGGKPVDNEEYAAYMEHMLDAYSERIGVEKFTLAKMKDLWNFAKPAFSGNEKGYKEMSKASSIENFRICMKQFIRNSELL